MINDYDDVYILQDDEQPNPLYGMETFTLTPNVIACLQAGKRIYISVNDEYAVVLKLENLETVQPVKKIGYAECTSAMLKMWIDDILTDGEYNRIMDSLNAHYNAERRQDR